MRVECLKKYPGSMVELKNAVPVDRRGNSCAFGVSISASSLIKCIRVEDRDVEFDYVHDA